MGKIYTFVVLGPGRDRDLPTQWAGNRTAEDLEEYRRQRNGATIDGLPALAGPGPTAR
jgi:hypothetical protein